MVNVHFSLLPRWRGAAPVERALLAGDDVTGVCIMAVEEGLDTGGVYARREVPIGPGPRPSELRAELVDVGTELLVDVLGRTARPTPDAAGRRVDLRRQDRPGRAASSTGPARRSSSTVGARRRGVDDVPRPPPEGARGRAAAAGATAAPGTLVADAAPSAPATAALRLVTVQPEGKAPMPWRDFANGARSSPANGSASSRASRLRR